MWQMTHADGAVANQFGGPDARRVPADGAASAVMSAEQRKELARLDAQHRDRCARMMQIKEAYEAGRLSFDQELVRAREIQREIVAIGARMYELVRERPLSMSR